MEKITNREALVAVSECEALPQEVRDWAVYKVALLDASNAKAAERRAAKKADETGLNDAIVEAIGEDELSCSSILEKIKPNFDISVQKVSSKAKELCKEGVLVQGEAKISGRKVKVYSKA